MNGVYPVHNNVFKINTAGRSGTDTSLVIIKDLTTFGVSIEGTNEEWFPLDQEGWARQANTGKKMSISFSGKRNFGDPGNDYVAGMLTKTGKDCETSFEWVLPNGSKLSGDCIVNLTNPGGGDSTALMALEFELLIDGKPTFTSAE
jgi:hypothetical protein